MLGNSEERAQRGERGDKRLIKEASRLQDILSKDIKAGMQRDSPLSPIETLARLDCLVWGLIPGSDRKGIDQWIDDKEYLPPVHLHISK